jgi:hypothetical protein
MISRYPCLQDDTRLPGESSIIFFPHYQGTAYNLLLESLRRRALSGRVMSVKEWGRMKKVRTPSVE